MIRNRDKYVSQNFHSVTKLFCFAYFSALSLSTLICLKLVSLDILSFLIKLFRYVGILNGIDTAMWNPATDIFLLAKFNGNVSHKTFFPLYKEDNSEL